MKIEVSEYKLKEVLQLAAVLANMNLERGEGFSIAVAGDRVIFHA